VGGWTTIKVRVVLAAALASGALALDAGPAHAETVTCHPTGHPRGTVILLHLGGWVWKGAGEYAPLCHRFAKAGFLAVSPEYPTGSFDPANRYVARLAANARKPVFAAGDSAGGAMSAMLAARGLVTAAVDVAGPVDLLTWTPPPDARRGKRPLDWLRNDGLTVTERGARRWSAARTWGRRHGKLAIFHSPDDHVVPMQQARLMAHVARTRVRLLTGAHCGDRGWETRTLRWFGQLAAARRAGSG
jgi:acetyl esterase/lipase